MEGNLDGNLISLLESTPGIIRTKSGLVKWTIDSTNWLKLLTMDDPMTAVKAGQWVRVCKGAYKGDLGFVKNVEAWGAIVLVVPRLEMSTPPASTSLKRKRSAIRPEQSLFDAATFSSVFNRQPRLHRNGIYTSRRLCFDHGLLQLNLDLHSITLNIAGIPSRILGLFKLSSHPFLTEAAYPCPEEWIFEEGERVIVCRGNSEKVATIAAVKSTHLEVDLAMNEGVEAVSWYSPKGLLNWGLRQRHERSIKRKDGMGRAHQDGYCLCPGIQGGGQSLKFQQGY